MSEITLETVAKGLEMLAEQMTHIATSLNAVHKQQTEENKEDMLLEVLRREKQIHDTVSVCEDIKSELSARNTDEFIDYSKIQFIIGFDSKIRVLGNDWLRTDRIAEIVKAQIYKTFEEQNTSELNAENLQPPATHEEAEIFVGKSPDVEERVIHEEAVGNVPPEEDLIEEFTAGKNPEVASIHDGIPVPPYGDIDSAVSILPPPSTGSIMYPYDPDAEKI